MTTAIAATPVGTAGRKIEVVFPDGSTTQINGKNATHLVVALSSWPYKGWAVLGINSRYDLAAADAVKWAKAPTTKHTHIVVVEED